MRWSITIQALCLLAALTLMNVTGGKNLCLAATAQDRVVQRLRQNAQASLESGDLAHAAGQLEQALTLEPQHKAARIALSHALIRLIEQLKLPYAWPFVDLGLLLVNEDEHDRGLGWLYRAVRNDPASPYAHYHYAKALFRQGASFEVKAELDAALKLDPGYGDAWYLLGRYYQKAGQENLAKETFAKFAEIKKNPLPSPFGVRRW